MCVRVDTACDSGLVLSPLLVVATEGETTVVGSTALGLLRVVVVGVAAAERKTTAAAAAAVGCSTDQKQIAGAGSIVL